MDGSGNLVGEAKAARAEIDNLKKSTDALNTSNKSYWAEQQAAANASAAAWLKGNAAVDAAADKAWALSNGYKEVGGQIVKTGAAATKGLDEVTFATARAKQEMVVLGREIAQGNFSRMPGTLSIIAQGLSPLGLAIGGVSALLAAGGYAWYEYSKKAKEASAGVRDAFLGDSEKISEKLEAETILLKQRAALAGAGIVSQSDEATKNLTLMKILNEQQQANIDSGNLGYVQKIQAQIDLNERVKEYDRLMSAVAGKEKAAAELKLLTNPKEPKEPKDKPKPKIDPNDTAVTAMQAELFRKQMEEMGVSAAQTKVYELAMKGATAAQIEQAQATADGIDKINAEAAARDNAQKSLAKQTAELDRAAEARKKYNAHLAEQEQHDIDAAATAQAAGLKKSSDEINRSLTDGLMRAFESGKGFAQAFRDTLVNMFKTMILQPTISAILSPVSGGMASMMSGGGGAAGIGAIGTAGWIGLGVVAAAAIVNRLGFDHGNKSAAEVQAVEATGAVFGDMAAKSATIATVSQAIKLNSDEGLTYSKGMLDALQRMVSDINSFTSMLVRTNPSLTSGSNFGLPQGQIGQSHMGMFDIGSIQGFDLGNTLFPGVKWLANNFSKTTQQITDTGLKLSGTLGDLMGGKGIQQYMDSNHTDSKYWGMQKNTYANPTQYAGVSEELARTFGMIFTNLHDILLDAGTSLGRDTSIIDTVMKNLDVSTQISLKGLGGQALSDAISRMITNMSDKVVKATFGDVLAYAHVGEDALTTLVRVANETETVSVALDRLGVAAKPAADQMMGVAEALIAAAGGADAYTSKMDYFSKNFLTQAQQLVPVQHAVNKAFADLNMSIPASKEEFVALMQSADVSTESGRALQVALLNIAPAFNAVATAAGDATAKLLALIKTDSFSTSLAYTMAMAKAMAPTKAKVPGFATGGDFGGGLRIVGENGPELEATGPSRITNNGDTRKLLDNTELVAEVRALRAEVAALRRSSEKTASNTGAQESFMRRISPDGNSINVTVSA
jgi:hypothetical protein